MLVLGQGVWPFPLRARTGSASGLMFTLRLRRVLTGMAARVSERRVRVLADVEPWRLLEEAKVKQKRSIYTMLFPSLAQISFFEGGYSPQNYL